MRDIKKFVVFSHGRAGTNFLMNNLSSHPEIKISMEPFHNEPKARSEANGRVWSDKNSSASFAYNQILTRSEPDHRAAGFKLFYFHCRQSAVAADLWSKLHSDTDVQLIFLNRRNLLNKHLSDLRARKSGVWHPRMQDYLKSEYGKTVRIEVNIAELMRVMFELYCGYHRIAERFDQHTAHHYFFEDLPETNEAVLAEVYDSLGVSPVPIANPFRSGTLSKETTEIVNADAVRDAVASSIFADYLETCPLL